MTVKKIDTHVHYLPPAYEAMLDCRNLTKLDGGFPRPSWSAEAALESMEQLQVSKSYLSISSPVPHFGDAVEAIETTRACNEFGADLMKQYPEQFGILASLPLPEIEAAVAEIQYCHSQLGIQNFTLATNTFGLYLGDPKLDSVMAALNAIGAIVSIHPTMPAAVPEGIHKGIPYPFMEIFFDTTRTLANMLVYDIVKRYPNIKFIVPHAGACMPILADRLATMPIVIPSMEGIDVMADLSSFYYDLAGFSMPKQYDALRKTVDESHLLYGSDVPFTPLPVCKKLAAEMDQKLGDEMIQKVYLENPAALFGL